MTTRLPITLLTLAALAFTPACKKEPTQNPDDAADTGGTEPEPEPEGPPPLPAQDPDPAEIATLYARYLQGDYEAVAVEATALAAAQTADTQLRAKSLAASIAALASAETVPENGKAGSELAIVDGDRLADVEVQQLAHIAHGTVLVRTGDAAGGQTELEAAVALTGPYVALGHLMLAEAHLNQAFGQGEEEDQIKDPTRLDSAKAQYEAVLTATEPILQGQAHEGLAAVAKLKGEKDAICTHAQEAENLYAANGATTGLREVPGILAKDGKCKKFKKAK
jgi:hypothetical protein